MRAPLVIAGLFVATRVVALAGMMSASGGSLRIALWAAGSRWDSAWYQILLTGGYANNSPNLPKAAFYPGYSGLAAIVYEPLRFLATRLAAGYVPSHPLSVDEHYGNDPLVVASLLIVSNVSLVIALVALWRLYESELGATATVIGCGLLLTAPTAFFLSSAYTESPFIAATVLFFLFAQRGRWVAAGAAGLVACLIREPGVWLVVPLAIIWLRAPRPRPVWPAIAGAAVLLAGAALFPVYSLFAFGDPLLYVHLQATIWGHRPTNPLRSVRSVVREAYLAVLLQVRASWLPSTPALMPTQAELPPGAGVHTYLLNGAALAWVAVTAPLAWLKLHPAQAVWIVLMAGLSLVTGVLQLSYGRYILSAWPAFFVAGWFLRRIPVAAAAIMLVDTAAMFILAQDYAQGQVFIG